MTSKNFLAGCVAGVALFLGGCDVSPDYQDLSRFMDEARARPKGTIEPLPQFIPYEAFTYSASGLRSPFERPMNVVVKREQAIDMDVKPDLDRVKQFLENFSFDSFAMVGTISDDQGFYALVSADESVYKVTVGDYMGRNHGRIVGITGSEVQIIEIVRSGADGWVERPRTLGLREPL